MRAQGSELLTRWSVGQAIILIESLQIAIGRRAAKRIDNHDCLALAGIALVQDGGQIIGIAIELGSVARTAERRFAVSETRRLLARPAQQVALHGKRTNAAGGYAGSPSE